jgi:hypothetical protein
MLSNQQRDWLVGRRYLSEGSMALVLAGTADDDVTEKPSGLATGHAA